MISTLKRNPIFLAIAAVVLVAVLWFAWWTISPLFVRTSLVEGENINVPAASAPTPEGEMMEGESEGAMAEEDKAMEKPMGAAVLAVGSFDRKDDVHYANGQAILAREADGSYVVRLQDLDAANGPDLYVYVSEHPNPNTGDELHQGGHNLGTLKATSGSFSYTLDPSIDPAKIKSVVIYCRAFSVIFSTAALQLQ